MKLKPSGYKTALESREPGYLKDRFEQIKKARKKAAEAERDHKVTSILRKTSHG